MTDQVKRASDRDGENGWGTAFVVTKPIRPDQLMGELADAMNWRKVSGCVVDGDIAAASADKPITVWVDRTDLDVAVFERVVVAHEPSMSWVARQEDEPTLADVTEKASRGEALTPGEQQVALRSLLTGETPAAQG